MWSSLVHIFNPCCAFGNYSLLLTTTEVGITPTEMNDKKREKMAEDTWQQLQDKYEME